jgi:CheY-like chemotaxis protein/predicted regulator of Ras-like GTPase activity (Roadblock/LC7/MglB family)
MIRLLIVDDEAPLLKNLGSYLASFGDEFEVVTAATGEEALEVVEADPGIDLLLTDVRLPGIDGVDLVRRAAAKRPHLTVLVMTAFPSRDIRRAVTDLGALRYLEKPLDLKQLRQALLEAATSREGWSGSVGGLDLFDFTQLFALSGKSTAVRVAWGDRAGHMVFQEGALVHASTDDLDGEEAFYAMTRWRGGTLSETAQPDPTSLPHNIGASTNHLIMEAARMRDEEARGAANQESPSSSVDDVLDLLSLAGQGSGVGQTRNRKEVHVMAIKDHLAELEEVQGFQGAAVFTAQGEMLEGLAKGKLDIKTVGLYANNALLNAQKATDQMGVGRGNMVQIRAPQALVLMRCLNEATDFAATKEGKAHFHTVVVLEPEGNTGMASMLLDKAVAKVADELR